MLEGWKVKPIRVGDSSSDEEWVLVVPYGALMTESVSQQRQVL